MEGWSMALSSLPPCWSFMSCGRWKWRWVPHLDLVASCCSSKLGRAAPSRCRGWDGQNGDKTWIVQDQAEPCYLVLHPKWLKSDTGPCACPPRLRSLMHKCHGMRWRSTQGAERCGSCPRGGQGRTHSLGSGEVEVSRLGSARWTHRPRVGRGRSFLPQVSESDNHFIGSGDTISW